MMVDSWTKGRSVHVPLEVVETILNYLKDQEEYSALCTALLVNKTWFHAAVQIIYKDPFYFIQVPYTTFCTLVWKHRLRLFETLCKNVKPLSNTRPYSTFVDYISFASTLDHNSIFVTALHAARYISEQAYRYCPHWSMEMTRRISQAHLDRAHNLNFLRLGSCPTPDMRDMLKHPGMSYILLQNQVGQQSAGALSSRELFSEISTLDTLKGLYGVINFSDPDILYPIFERKGGLEHCVLQYGKNSPSYLNLLAKNHSKSLKKLQLHSFRPSDNDFDFICEFSNLEILRLPRLQSNDPKLGFRILNIVKSCPYLNTLDMIHVHIPFSDLAEIINLMGPRVNDLRLSPRRNPTMEDGDEDVSKFLFSLSKCVNIRRLILDCTMDSPALWAGLLSVANIDSWLQVVQEMKGSIRFFQARSLFMPVVTPEEAEPAFLAMAENWSSTLLALYLENCPITDSFLREYCMPSVNQEIQWIAPVQYMTFPMCNFLTDDSVRYLVKGAVGIDLPCGTFDVYEKGKGKQIDRQAFGDSNHFNRMGPHSLDLEQMAQFGDFGDEIGSNNSRTLTFSSTLGDNDTYMESSEESLMEIDANIKQRLKHLRLITFYMCIGISEEIKQVAHHYLSSVGVLFAETDMHSQGRKPLRLSKLKINDYLEARDWEEIRIRSGTRWKKRGSKRRNDNRRNPSAMSEG